MKNEKIKTTEAIAFLTVLSITNIILSTSQYLLNDCNSASLLNSIYITMISMIITMIFCILAKPFIKKNLLVISQFLGGKALKVIVGLSFSFFFIFRAAILLKKLCICLQTIYYPMTNIIFIVTIFCIATALILKLQNNSLLKSTLIVVPLLFLSIILIFIGNLQNFNFENIYPIFGNGLKATFLTGLNNLWVFNSLAYLWFIPSRLKNPDHFNKIAITSTLLTGVFLFIAIGNIVFLFSDTLDNSTLFPLYLSSRYIEFGSFFQRMEPLFLFFCTLGFICTLCVNAFIVIDIFKDVFNLSNEKPIIYPYLLTLGGIAVSIKKISTIEYLENNIAKISFFILGILVPFIILLLANIKNKLLRRKLN